MLNRRGFIAALTGGPFAGWFAQRQLTTPWSENTLGIPILESVTAARNDGLMGLQYYQNNFNVGNYMGIARSHYPSPRKVTPRQRQSAFGPQ